jgi:pimeloyl-ACP methyl ester carboxylesterase
MKSGAEVVRSGEGRERRPGQASPQRATFQPGVECYLNEGVATVEPGAIVAWLTDGVRWATHAQGVFIMDSHSGDAILMIHGLCCAGEMWSAPAARFRARGWRVETPTIHAQLRLRSAPPRELGGLTLADYVAEMEGVARRLHAESGRWPVVFGHSLGGLIAQKLAERGAARAVVLMAPVGPEGTGGKASMSTVLTFANLLVTRKAAARGFKIWKTGFQWGMWHRLPRSRHAALHASTRYCSGRVLRDAARPELDPLRVARVDEARVEVPLLTIGATRDRTIPVAVHRAVAEKYRRVGAEYREYEEHAHWILDEPGSERVVDDIARWLDAKVKG